jgi:hypothetical protein
MDKDTRDQASLERQLQSAKILWMAFAASTVFYLFIALTTDPSNRPLERSHVANLIWLFGIGFAAVGLILPEILFKSASPSQRLLKSPIMKYVLFEMLALCGLINYMTFGVSMNEAVIGFVAAFALIIFNKPKIT